jgi:hypothetical protein
MAGRGRSIKGPIHGAAVMRTAIAVIGLLILSAPLNAQTRYLATSTLGMAGSLGYKTPTYGGSFAIEQPLGRLELQGLAGVFFTRKIDSGSGHSAIVQVGSYWFPARSAGLGIKVARHWLWTNAYDKHSIEVAPTLLLQGKMGVPARLYASYQLPRGCGNCTGIQSSRTHGVEIYWEHELGHFGPVTLLLGHQFDVLKFKNQGPPGAPPSAWVWHTGRMYEANLRFRFGGANKRPGNH